MSCEYKRFVMVVMMICGIAVVVGLTLGFSNSNELITILLLPTLIFIPTAIIIIKFKLYVPANNSNITRILTIIMFMAGLVIAPKLGSAVKGCIVVFVFEISVLLYVLIVKMEKTLRKQG